MAFTQADFDGLEEALVSKYLTVRFSDGRLVTYRSPREIREAMAVVKADLAETAGTRVRMIKPYTDSGY